MDDTSPEDSDQPWEGLSLEELGQAYAQVVARTAPELDGEPSDEQPGPPQLSDAPLPDDDETLVDAVPSLGAIIEGALFIGHADGRGIQESELAALMRDVTSEEVAEEIDRLNESYKQNHQALRILRDDSGLRLGVAADLETVRRAFYGKVREATLSQGAVEVLSLVAYQPGITAEKVQDQRGKESASLLSQLVRRRLLEQRRVVHEGDRRPVATYFPTERFLNLFGLESLDDLPQFEE
ncbi:MAG: SMC-Scp complex subunit ScpB [Planctomycetaceae bacterium]